MLAAIFMAVLTVSILMHEYAHALVARRYRIGADRIDLYMFGGLVALQGGGRNVRQDCEITVAGPLSNLVLGLLACGALLLLPAHAPEMISVGGKIIAAPFAPPSMLERVLRMTAYINLALCIVNLLPAFPLDGGRIVYVLARQRWGSIFATRLVGSLGLVFASVSMAVLFMTLLAGFPIWSPPGFGDNWRAIQAAKRGQGSWESFAT
jgi:Zn-dependent protease